MALGFQVLSGFRHVEQALGVAQIVHPIVDVDDQVCADVAAFQLIKALYQLLLHRKAALGKVRVPLPLAAAREEVHAREIVQLGEAQQPVEGAVDVADEARPGRGAVDLGLRGVAPDVEAFLCEFVGGEVGEARGVDHRGGGCRVAEGGRVQVVGDHDADAGYPDDHEQENDRQRDLEARRKPELALALHCGGLV